MPDAGGLGVGVEDEDSPSQAEQAGTMVESELLL